MPHYVCPLNSRIFQRLFKQSGYSVVILKVDGGCFLKDIFSLPWTLLQFLP